MRYFALALLLLMPLTAQAAPKSFGKEIHAHLKSHFVSQAKWKGTKLEAKALVKLDQAGKVTSSVIEKSSGDKEFDETALKAIEDSDPFPAPPKEIVGEEIALIFKPD